MKFRQPHYFRSAFLCVLTPATVLLPLDQVRANSATIGKPGTFYLTPSYTYQSFDEFYAGDQLVDTPPNGEEINRQSFSLYFEYVMTEDWALDLSLGYFRTESGEGGPFNEGNQDGLADTGLGIRYALMRQAEKGMDLAARLGFTIPGDYETGQLSAPGDDAFGANLKLLAGYSFGSTRIEGLLGYGVNEGAVPETWIVGAKIIQELGAGFSLDVGYRYFDSSGNLDIGGPGFTPARLPEVSEKGNIFEIGAAFGDTGGRYYRLFYSQLFDGENVGREQTLGASVTFSF